MISWSYGVQFATPQLLNSPSCKKIMSKKEYMKPSMEVVKLQQQSQILAGSSYGMKTELSDNEVEDAW